MNFMITGRHLEVKPETDAYIREKFARVKRHFDHVLDAHFTLEVQKRDLVIKAHLHCQGTDFHAEERGGQWNEAIDLLYDTIDRDVLKWKEKHWGSKHATHPE